MNIKIRKLSTNAERLLNSMKQGSLVTYRYIGDEAWIDSGTNGNMEVFISSLLELKMAGLIKVKSYDKNVLWVTYEIA